MKISIDAMGGDHAPEEIVRGAVEAAGRFPDARLLLVGQKAKLVRPNLPANLELVPAADVVGMNEEPMRALLRKRDSSLLVSLGLVKHGQADAVISAGNTGALVAGTFLPLLGLGKLEGVKRPGIAAPLPTEKGLCALIDAGANPNAKPVHLVQYAVMGAVYVKYLRPELATPRVGLLNIGEEPTKGTNLLRETFGHLEKARLNFQFVGNVEPHTVFAGEVDVAVADGFVGNLVLKTAEGVKSFIFNHLPNGMGFVEDARDRLDRLAQRFDYSEGGGALVLGARGIVLKAHGRSRAPAIANAIKLAARFVQDRLNEHIVSELRRLAARGSWYAKWFAWPREDE